MFSLTHSPKNIGEVRNQFLWYFESNYTALKPTYKRLRKEDGAWNVLIEELGEYLRQYIPPYQLISVSIFEDAHPNTGNGINAVIAHIAGDNPKMQ